MSHLLVVEDDVPTHALLLTLAHRCGCETFSAYDGPPALRRMKSDRPDGILLDLLLPTLSGFEMLREMKSSMSDLLPKTIVITAAAESMLRNCEELQDVRAMFRKPFDIIGLEDELKLILGGRAPRAVSSKMRTGGTMRLKID